MPLQISRIKRVISGKLLKTHKCQLCDSHKGYQYNCKCGECYCNRCHHDYIINFLETNLELVGYNYDKITCISDLCQNEEYIHKFISEEIYLEKSNYNKTKCDKCGNNNGYKFRSHHSCNTNYCKECLKLYVISHITNYLSKQTFMCDSDKLNEHEYEFECPGLDCCKKINIDIIKTYDQNYIDNIYETLNKFKLSQCCSICQKNFGGNYICLCDSVICKECIYNNIINGLLPNFSTFTIFQIRNFIKNWCNELEMIDCINGYCMKQIKIKNCIDSDIIIERIIKDYLCCVCKNMISPKLRCSCDIKYCDKCYIFKINILINTQSTFMPYSIAKYKCIGFDCSVKHLYKNILTKTEYNTRIDKIKCKFCKKKNGILYNTHCSSCNYTCCSDCLLKYYRDRHISKYIDKSIYIDSKETISNYIKCLNKRCSNHIFLYDSIKTIIINKTQCQYCDTLTKERYIYDNEFICKDCAIKKLIHMLILQKHDNKPIDEIIPIITDIKLIHSNIKDIAIKHVKQYICDICNTNIGLNYNCSCSKHYCDDCIKDAIDTSEKVVYCKNQTYKNLKYRCLNEECQKHCITFSDYISIDRYIKLYEAYLCHICKSTIYDSICFCGGHYCSKCINELCYQEIKKNITQFIYNKEQNSITNIWNSEEELRLDLFKNIDISCHNPKKDKVCIIKLGIYLNEYTIKQLIDLFTCYSCNGLGTRYLHNIFMCDKCIHKNIKDSINQTQPEYLDYDTSVIIVTFIKYGKRNDSKQSHTSSIKVSEYINRELYEDFTRLIECQVCYSAYGSYVLENCCSKRYCRRCIKRYIIDLLSVKFMTRDSYYTLKVKCISPDCKHMLHIHNYLSIDEYEKNYKKYKIVSVQDYLSKINCSYINCEGFINENGTCKICQRYTCVRCLQEKLDGHICKTETLDMIDKVFRHGEGEAKQCPKCLLLIFKNGGCDHMKCGKCEYEFWWTTLKRYDLYR